MASDVEKTMWRELRRAGPPARISQEAFDFNDRHLRRLVQLAADAKAESADLWNYSQDLLYSGAIQADLFAFVLPFCLEAWRSDLRGTSRSYGGFVEYFYPVLAKHEVFETHLTSRQTAAVSDFMRQTILDEIDEQRGLRYKGTNMRPYRWFGAVATYGVLLPDIDLLWNAWWSLETIGRAVAAVQYLSCLMYDENENPVFEPWTPNEGGGPPCLWDFAGHLYTHRWLQKNIDFVRSTLSFERVSDVLVKAAARLLSDDEKAIAAEIVADIPLCAETIQARCGELPLMLETTQEAGRGFSFSR